MLDEALKNGWRTLETIPLKGDGEFMVITLSGLVRRARSRAEFTRIKKADAYGPKRTTVISATSGNYLAAIAWRPA